MTNLEKLIKGYAQKSDDMTVKNIDAIVTDVSSHFTSVNVELITGQKIQNLPNKSGEKIFIGQRVEVGYRTTPQAGWIERTIGKPNPLRLVGYDVETAAVFDANNIHQWTAEQELILDINANTKLMYGGHPKIISLQGYPCQFSTSSLSVDDASNFGNHLEFDSLWRASSNDAFIECHHVIDLYTKEMTYGTSTSGGVTTEKYNYTMTMIRKQYNKSTGELMYSNTVDSYYSFITPTDVFIVPRITNISFLPEFNGQSTPYGYVQHNRLQLYFVGIESGNPNQLRFASGQGSSSSFIINLVGNNGNNTYSCIPINSLAEKYFDLAMTQRTVPRNLGGG